MNTGQTSNGSTGRGSSSSSYWSLQTSRSSGTRSSTSSRPAGRSSSWWRVQRYTGPARWSHMATTVSRSRRWRWIRGRGAGLRRPADGGDGGFRAAGGRPLRESSSRTPGSLPPSASTRSTASCGFRSTAAADSSGRTSRCGCLWCSAFSSSCRRPPCPGCSPVLRHRIDPDHDRRDVVEAAAPVGLGDHPVHPALRSAIRAQNPVELLVLEHARQPVRGEQEHVALARASRNRCRARRPRSRRRSG